MKKEVITITFGDAAENHQGMQQLGSMNERGFSLQNLKHALEYFQNLGAQAQIIELHNQITEDEMPESTQCPSAYILVVKQGVKHLLGKDRTVKELHKELTNFQWDSKYFDTRRQKVLNKRARRNVCFGEKAQLPDFENKKGTIVPWENAPLLNSIRDKLNDIMGTEVQFHAEGNFYQDGGIKDTGVGYHGDAERKMVIAIRTGTNTMPLHYQWFYRSKPLGKNFSVDIAPGDLYVMSEKAVGTDWKKKTILTLRHASGAAKYIKV